MQSAKTILLNNTFVSNTEIPKRRARVEFQAYAYKLANDLNDLEHLQIYLKLAKNVERPLMEQAYSFVADASTPEKGKLFLWKLKKIREQIERERNKNNFTYDYVIKKQKEFKKVYSNEIVLKQDSEITDEVIDILKRYLSIKNKKVFMLGNSSRRIYKVIETLKPKACVLDLSPEITKINKSIKAKAICKDFLKNNYKESYFDIVLINNYWTQIPKESEITYLKELKRISKPNAVYIVLFKQYANNSETWKEYEYRKKIYSCYIKTFTSDSLIDQFEKFELKLEKKYSLGSYFVNTFIG